MPSYRVTAPGFHGGTYYKPGHPRHGKLHTDKPFDPVPSWLELIADEKPAEKKKRTSRAKTAAKKADSDKKDVESASFMTGPNAGVETL